MGDVISITEWKEKKNKNAQDYRDSLNNDKVMKKYNIKQPTIEERQQKISESIKRINNLISELEDKTK